MIRICSSLAQNGYDVAITGRKLSASLPLSTQNFRQKKIPCFFKKGMMFYTEYNIRLFFWLLFQKADALCAIDLDTILPVYFVSKLKGCKRIYDAHELFCEMKEIVTRPSRYKIWKWIERFTVPRFKYGYTVCKPIAMEFEKMYGVKYEVVRNVPVKEEPRTKKQEPNNKDQNVNSVPETSNLQPETFFLYQGAVNEGRSFETLIPAMKDVNAPLHIYGGGNFYHQTKELIQQNHLQEKVLLKGKLAPGELKTVTPSAYAGITLFENNGLSNYLSLANRFFDYIMAGIPQLAMDYPAYREMNKQFETALLIPDTSPKTIAHALNLLLTDVVLYERLKHNCIKAREVFNWQEEEQQLIAFYKHIIG
ncbi:MAG: glycosyltransferase [Chitinophagaceae bacterium]|nr:glycosyltransferase [Chitinophagaceae bacterium]